MVDDENDTPAAEQIRNRMEAQIAGTAPAVAPPMAMLAELMGMRPSFGEGRKEEQAEAAPARAKARL